MLKTLAALALLLIVGLPGAAQAGGVFIAFPFPFIFPFPFPFFGAPFFPPPFFPPPPAFFPPPPAFSPQPAVFQPQAAPTATTAHPAAATTHATRTKAAHTCHTFNGDATVDGTQQPFFGTACLGADKKWHIQQPQPG